MLVELVTNRNSHKNIKMSTENNLANKKEEVKKLPLVFLPLQAMLLYFYL
jgi:hypothetical protein